MLRVVIIGGGPAGSGMAITLLRAAPPGTVEVVIVEAKAFPRSKVCGEFVSPSATPILERLVKPELLRESGARQVHRLVLELDDREIAWAMPSPAWTLSRRALDSVLMNAARESGASVRQPERVSRVEYHESGVSVHVASGETLASDLVVHADGAGRHDPAGPTRQRDGVLGFKCFIRPDHPIDGIRMRAGRGGYIGTVGVEGGLATLALVARTDLLRACGADTDRLTTYLWPAFDAAWRVGDWLSCGVAGSGFIDPGHTRSFRLGNAAAAVEPVGGEGIGLALWSGELLGTLLGSVASANGASLPKSLDRIHATFAHSYRVRLRTRRPACRLAAEVLMRPWLVSAMWPVLGRPAISIRPWYRLTGKPVSPRTATRSSSFVTSSTIHPRARLGDPLRDLH